LKKLLIVVNSAKFFISHRLVLAENALSEGYNVQIAFPETEEENLSIIRSKNLNYRILQMTRSGRNIFKEFLSFFSLLSVILKEKPDILHLVTIKPVLYGGLIAKFLKIPTIFAISGMGHLYKKEENNILRIASNFIYKIILSNKKIRVIIQNKRDKEVLKSLGTLQDSKITLLPGSGVDLEEFSQSTPDTKVVTFLMPCRMLWDKGVREFVEASKEIKKQHPTANFILAGPYDPENPVRVPIEYLDSLNQGSTVKWLGDFTDMPKLYKEASVVVVPTFYNEGLPKVILEASASARPIITTNIPGCVDSVDDKITGLIVPIKDPSSLSKAMEEFIHQKQKIIEMGKSARIKAQKEFDINLVSSAHMSLYNTLSNISKDG
tara:strand:- start:1198 stop:2334 length:1137 start_codon:yes stop_codon:yes gene_type:complete